MTYDPTGTIFEFMFKERLTPDDIALVHDIARMRLVVHPVVFDRIKEVLNETK